MKHKSRFGFTLVELLVVIAIIAVLLAVLMPALRIAKAMSQRLQCKSLLGGMGKSLAIYADQYDGRMPNPAGDLIGNAPSIKTPYEVCIDSDHTGLRNTWMNLGCLYKAQLFPSPKALYCPAYPKGLEDLVNYRIGYDAAGNEIQIQWGATPNKATRSSSWWHVSVTYAFWPQTRKMLTQADYDIMSARGENPSARYTPNIYPGTPGKFSDMNPNKSLCSDYNPHAVKGSGWNVQTVFGDAHVNMQKCPTDPVTNKLWYPYQANMPEGESINNWVEVMPTAKYFYALQP